MFLYFEADQPYVPQQPDDGNGVVEFLTSVQTIMGVAAGLIALVMLLASLWPGRHHAREQKEEEREGRG
ncbi:MULTISPECIES: hypothetical protein [unclassified Streptomyces]|uniref:hypothetical protein n=1 Tax=unclassified Streptomyces TaxID=2593676 RepID=UPI002DDABB26|nr:hypothetical protein [Streptomyces sp. NBC_00243]WRZ17364.1 hypothetical protein OHT59_02155 [Streptomyces sp. NBC_00243]